MSQPKENEATVQAAQPKSSKRKMLIFTTVIVVVVVAIVGGLFVTGFFSSHSQALVWNPKVGDFMVWTASGFDMTMRIEVKTVTVDSLMLKTTITSALGSGTTETVVPLNNTVGANYNLKNLGAGVTMTDRGTESLTTKWGSKPAKHYTVVDNSSPGISITTDMWIMDKILLKSVQSISGVTITTTLTDTNISAVTG